MNRYRREIHNSLNFNGLEYEFNRSEAGGQSFGISVLEFFATERENATLAG